MFSRFEDKILVKKNKNLLLLNWNKENSGKKIYPQQKITSIYFDNYLLQAYHDSNEGMVPRKKIRIRYYNEEKIEALSKKKINSAERRYKFAYKTANKVIRNITDDKYGVCCPKTKVNYIRNYFFLLNK
jgi:SPX domain protein involved in polyphosphate accumulation